MKTESSFKDTRAEGGSAAWVSTMNLLLIPLVGCVCPLTSEERVLRKEQLKLRARKPHSPGLDFIWNWGRMYFYF